MNIQTKYPGKFRLNPESGCWEWLGCKTKKGHGQVKIGGRKGRVEYVHRLSWQIANGPIPLGRWVLHRCNNAGCGNPEHLYLGTHDDNMRDMKAAGTRRNKTRGERSGRAKLTEADIPVIRAAAARGEECASIAERYAVSKGCIQHIVHRINWSHVV